LDEWLGTADGLIKIITALFSTICALIIAVTGLLKPIFEYAGLPNTAGLSVTAAILVVFIACIRGIIIAATLDKAGLSDRTSSRSLQPHRRTSLGVLAIWSVCYAQ
jgi:uncharacterized membrane protein required for colicin V production